VPGEKVKAVDTSGAGDMFAGAFLYAVTHGYSHIDAARLANRAAGQVVSQYGKRLARDRTQAIKAHFEQKPTP
jgi:sugar/nucleoside kinase (ribokinase family)